MQPIFQIYPSGSRILPFEQCDLFIDVGEKHFCLAVMIHETKEFVALEHYNLKTFSISELKEMFQSNIYVKQSYLNVNIFYNFPGANLIPERFYDAEQSGVLLELMNGDLNDRITLHDELSSKSIYTVYDVNMELHQEMVRIFPDARFSHFISVFISRDVYLPGAFLDIAIYPDNFIIGFWKLGKLQLAQYYDYDYPEDITYHILNVLTQWNCETEDVQISLGGIIETQSPIYNEILKYFPKVSLHQRPIHFRYDFEFDRYPQHYFSTIFSLAL
ncbi:MAG: DUF3822 family protein [Chitinophagaceae bacterium]